MSGFKSAGYSSGGPTAFSNSMLYGWDGRPQEFGSQLAIHELDVAISGDDWMMERKMEMAFEYDSELDLEKVLSLKRAVVRVVGLVTAETSCGDTEEFLKSFFKAHNLLTVVSEMPYVALNWIREKLKAVGLFEEFSQYSVQKYKTPAKIEKGILIYETWGKTEAKLKNGGADYGIEISQTGSAIRNYGLRIIDTVMESEAGVWVSPRLREDMEKSELLRMFLLNLKGSVNAEDKVMIVFNVPNHKCEDIERYLMDNSLYGDEPTVIRGTRYTEYTVQLEFNSPKLPISKVRFELALRGAKNINTMPIDSCISGIEEADW